MDLTATHPDELALEADLDQTVRDLAPRLLRFALGRSARHDAPLAEEATQDALAALVDRWRRHGAPRSAEAFAFSVLRRRLARAQVRRALSSPLDTLRGAFGADASGANDGGFDLPASVDPEQHADARAELRRVRAGLGRLTPKLREALLLVSAGEMDTRGAARVLGISASALKMRVSRAREQLRQQLAEER